MNFIDLCRATREKCGISGGGPGAVTGQTGEMLRIVNWVNEAWMEIQNASPTWMWMRRPFSLVLVNGQHAYDRTLAVPAAQFGYWHTYTLRLSGGPLPVAQRLAHVDYLTFRDTHMLAPIARGAPLAFAVRPWDSALLLSPAPDAAYTITGEYQQAAQPMVLNGDEPGMPRPYRMLIVYEAMKRYATFEAAPEVLMGVSEERRRMMRALEINQQMPMMAPGSLI